MTEPCTQSETIGELRDNHMALHHQQQTTDAKVDSVLKNQEELLIQLKEQFSRFETILLSEVEQRKDIEQIKSDREVLYKKTRSLEEVTRELTQYQQACEVLDIKGKVKALYEASVEKKGVKHYRGEIVGAIAVVVMLLSFLLPYVSFGDDEKHNENTPRVVLGDD